MPQFLYQVYYNNTILKYLQFFVSVIVCFIIIRIAGRFAFKHLARLAGKTKSTFDDLLIKY